MRFGNSNKRFVIGVHGCSPMQLRFIIWYEKKLRIEIVRNMTSLAHLLKHLIFQQDTSHKLLLSTSRCIIKIISTKLSLHFV